jgi:DNA-binding PadR family transcriptional regulator
LRPFQTDDHALLKAVARGEFAIHGFRNRNLQRLLYPESQTLPERERRRRPAAVSRKLRMLRAHGLIQKVPKTHRYQVTAAGRRAIRAVLTMPQTSVSARNRAAA